MRKCQHVKQTTTKKTQTLSITSKLSTHSSRIVSSMSKLSPSCQHFIPRESPPRGLRHFDPQSHSVTSGLLVSEINKRILQRSCVSGDIPQKSQCLLHPHPVVVDHRWQTDHAARNQDPKRQVVNALPACLFHLLIEVELRQHAKVESNSCSCTIILEHNHPPSQIPCRTWRTKAGSLITLAAATPIQIIV